MTWARPCSPAALSGLVITVAPVDVRIDAEAIVLSWNPFRPISLPPACGFQSPACDFCALDRRTGDLAGRRFHIRRSAPDEQRRCVHTARYASGRMVYHMIVPKSWQGLGLISQITAMRQLMDRLAQQQLLTLTRTDDPLVRPPPDRAALGRMANWGAESCRLGAASRHGPFSASSRNMVKVLPSWSMACARKWLNYLEDASPVDLHGHRFSAGYFRAERVPQTLNGHAPARTRQAAAG